MKLYFSTRKKFEELEKKAEVRVTELNERQKKFIKFLEKGGKLTRTDYEK